MLSSSTTYLIQSCPLVEALPLTKDPLHGKRSDMSHMKSYFARYAQTYVHVCRLGMSLPETAKSRRLLLPKILLQAYCRLPACERPCPWSRQGLLAEGVYPAEEWYQPGSAREPSHFTSVRTLVIYQRRRERKHYSESQYEPAYMHSKSLTAQ